LRSRSIISFPWDRVFVIVEESRLELVCDVMEPIWDRRSLIGSILVRMAFLSVSVLLRCPQFQSQLFDPSFQTRNLVVAFEQDDLQVVYLGKR